MAAGGPQRATDAVSLGFVRDMSVHHAQAVRMSEIAHRRSSDPELNYLAFDILSTQQGQIGIMTGWLDLWEQGQSGDDAPMAWMGHEGPMPGMASDEELARLDRLPVAQMEELWLRLMIRHHRGAVPMADDAAARADDDETAALAASMSAGQSSEIELMERMLAERGLAPEPPACQTCTRGTGAHPLSSTGTAGSSGRVGAETEASRNENRATRGAHRRYSSAWCTVTHGRSRTSSPRAPRLALEDRPDLVLVLQRAEREQHPPGEARAGRPARRAGPRPLRTHGRRTGGSALPRRRAPTPAACGRCSRAAWPREESRRPRQAGSAATARPR